MLTKIKGALVAIPAASMLAAGNAIAAVPAEVTSELAGLKEGAIAIATAVLIALVAVAAFKFMRKGL